MAWPIPLWKTLIVRDHERGLRFVDGNLRGVLLPGRYRVSRWRLVRWLSGAHERIDVLDTMSDRFAHAEQEVLVRSPELADHLITVDVAAGERAIVWREGRLHDVLGPGLRAYWKHPFRYDVERFDASAFRLEHERLDAILAHPGIASVLGSIEVPPWHEVLVLNEGRLVDRIREGRYAIWRTSASPQMESVDLREQTLDVQGQEIMTQDKVTLRVNLVVAFQVTDPPKAVTTVSDAQGALYREAQLVLRAAVGARALDALLEDKEALGEQVRTSLAKRAAAFGVAVRSVGLKDIILPGDMKAILNQVIEATKRAEADLIRRREETASARSQANTAKLLADNPVLARLKELELLREVLAGTNASFVFGDADLATQVSRLVAGAPAPDTAA